MNNRIEKTKLINWKEIKLFQPSNLKKMSDIQLKKLKTSLVNNGFSTPFYVWENKEKIYCLDGHHRIPALKLLEDEGVIIPKMLPANFIDCKNKKEAKKAVLIFNSHYADILQDNLSEWISDLNLDELNSEIDIKDINFDFPISETENDDEVPEDVKPITKLGDLWELGRHRVLCGDSTKIEDVERLMDGNKASVSFQSPPYNVGHNLGYDSKSKYHNSNDNMDNYREFIINTTQNSLSISNDVFINIQILANNKKDIILFIGDLVDNLKDIFFWKKLQVAPAMAYNVANSQVELIILFNKNNNSRSWGNNKFKGNFSNYIETNSNKENPDTKNHNAGYPVELPLKFLNHGYENNSICCDLFIGTGSTLIACEKAKKICYGMELDEYYCDVVANRYNNWCIDNNITPEIKLNGKIYSLRTTGKQG